jgi:predicted neuraminidase
MEIISREYLKTFTPFVHAATIEFFKENPVFAWFGGEREGSSDCSIFLFNLKGKEDLIIIGNRDMVPRWNPILFAHKNKLLLFEKSGLFCDRWTTFIHDVTDWDKSISIKEIDETAQILPAGLNGPVKTRPLYCQEKDLLICGSSVETIYDWTSYIEEYKITSSSKLNFIGRSNPINISNKNIYIDPLSGRTLTTKGVIQPAIWFDSKSSKINALLRYSGNKPYLHFSTGEIGENWSNPVPTNIANPNSSVSIATVGDRIFLAYNPSSTHRSPLCVSEIELVDATSHNARFNIKDTMIISDKVDLNLPMNTGELSYPYLVENNKNLHLVYTVGRIRLEYVVIKI